MSLLLGCIADDFTGGTDLAGTLSAEGMRTVQSIGVPDGPVADTDAVVIALKSRTAPPAVAVAESLAALRWLRAQGCQQYFFKYCSTFDSTPAGNIGPVAEALLAELGADFTIACPAYPENGRTVYRGHLFVGDELLSESGMKDHPLTPMTDARLLRVLQPQTRLRVGLITHEVVATGSAAIAAACRRAAAAGTGIAIVDAISTADLRAIGNACTGMLLVTGGSGVALGLPDNFRRSGELPATRDISSFPRIDGSAAIIAGSCSTATRAQVAQWLRHHPGFRVDVLRLLEGADISGEALAWATTQHGQPVLIYATAAPEDIRAVQAAAGTQAVGAQIEQTLADIAAGLVNAGTCRLVIAGGETSGAVVKRLGLRALSIGPVIEPGVPWTCSIDAQPLALALKSGNFGSRDFFEKALASLP
ncbi:MAG: four-carbon acid sugar kinase family protein [Burkholderiales bacterium]|nr:four-carbon acid sugar kinase family protein [Burkholderiales bacterium]